MEEKKEVRTFEVDFKCPKCDIGYIRPTGIPVGGNPIQYPHKCNNCDYYEIMKGYQYPYHVYEPLFNITMVMNTIENLQDKEHVEPTNQINNYVIKPCGK